ncbi:hypothetical protein ACFZCP_22415 [Streptomyces sp. NPDC007971]|uniref:hypothetical protein n=1 Tax=Streptomyces sp. NPDC007971 TaxID=3364799 RepID=UPI0036E6E685
MRWTDESGAVYGEDPYDGVGYVRAYSHEHGYGGSVTTDTAPQPWDAVRAAQWTQPTGHTPTTWDSPHGDVLTAQLPVFDATGLSGAEPDTPESESGRPVFVDSSGRRQRRVRRAARLLVIPAGVYVVLLISTLLGGPSISSPFVPQAGSTHPATPRATAPGTSSGTGHPARSAGPGAGHNSSGAAARKTPGPAERSAASTAPAATPRSTAAPTSIAAPAPAPAPTAAPAPSSKGRALGSSHRPVK